MLAPYSGSDIDKIKFGWKWLQKSKLMRAQTDVLQQTLTLTSVGCEAFPFHWKRMKVKIVFETNMQWNKWVVCVVYTFGMSCCAQNENCFGVLAHVNGVISLKMFTNMWGPNPNCLPKMPADVRTKSNRISSQSMAIECCRLWWYGEREGRLEKL